MTFLDWIILGALVGVSISWLLLLTVTITGNLRDAADDEDEDDED